MTEQAAVEVATELVLHETGIAVPVGNACLAQEGLQVIPNDPMQSRLLRLVAAIGRK